MDGIRDELVVVVVVLMIHLLLFLDAEIQLSHQSFQRFKEEASAPQFIPFSPSLACK
jgi:hypothetical protein